MAARSLRNDAQPVEEMVGSGGGVHFDANFPQFPTFKTKRLLWWLVDGYHKSSL